MSPDEMDIAPQFAGLHAVMTQGVSALPDEDRVAVVARVQQYTFGSAEDVAAGTADTEHGGENCDPYSEHDFGSFCHKSTQYFWKIDDYGEDYLEHGANKRRVLTILRADEY
jgi:hypothetical protein